MRSRSDVDPWIASWRPRPQARVRLLCFPYAGGGTLAYRSWVQKMPPEIEVCPVALPGRERRLKEKPFRRLDRLLEVMVPALLPWLDRPFAIFGHSMGALIAYEMALELGRQGGRGPAHVLVSARGAPRPFPANRKYYALPDGEFQEHLRAMNGTPEQVFENRELMNLVLPLIRADFELNETYHPGRLTPLDCPITAFGGTSDQLVSPGELEAWGELTHDRFQVRMFSGDHFYLQRESQDSLLAAVAESVLGSI